MVDSFILTNVKKSLIVLALGFLVTSCASQGNSKSLIEVLEFGPDETGCFRLNGVVDTGGNPFVSANVNVNLIKKRGDGPDC